MNALPKASEELAAGVQRVFSAAAATLYDGINAASSPVQLDEFARLVWKAYGDKVISEGDASHLSECIERRRPPGRRPAAEHGNSNCRTIGNLASRVSSKFPKRRPQCSPDRQKSYDRRHRLAFSGVMPHHLTAHLTVADMACMRIVADEYRTHAVCDLALDEIAAAAGDVEG
jgi:hypothetical protein